MAQCPVCASSLSDDFGLIECGECGAPLIVHMDGRVEHSGDGVKVQEPSETSQVRDAESLASGEEVPEFVEPFREFEPEPEPELEKTSYTNVNSNDPESLISEPPALFEEDPIQNESEFTPEEPAAFIDPMSALDSPADEPSSEPYVSPQAKTFDSPDLADVAQFANSANSGGRDGSLRYSIFIEGIDTADVRIAFKEAITDKKLLWDTEKILKSIRQGRVHIENVSSAKAHIVVTRLKHLPVSVKWEQHAIHES